MEHEVLAAHSQRLALTAWLYASPQVCPPRVAHSVDYWRPPSALSADGDAGGAGGGAGAGAGAGAGSGAHASDTSGAAPEPRRPNTIFVSIVSYRDPEAAHTVSALFKRAACPQAVFVGLVLQHDSAGEDAALFQIASVVPAQFQSPVQLPGTPGICRHWMLIAHQTHIHRFAYCGWHPRRRLALPTRAM